MFGSSTSLPAFSLTIVSAALLLSRVKNSSVAPITTVVRLPPPLLSLILIRTKIPITISRTTTTNSSDNVSDIAIGTSSSMPVRFPDWLGVPTPNVQAERHPAKWDGASTFNFAKLRFIIAYIACEPGPALRIRGAVGATEPRLSPQRVGAESLGLCQRHRPDLSAVLSLLADLTTICVAVGRAPVCRLLGAGKAPLPTFCDAHPSHRASMPTIPVR
jgi:hypothetical protein